MPETDDLNHTSFSRDNPRVQATPGDVLQQVGHYLTEAEPSGYVT